MKRGRAGAGVAHGVAVRFGRDGDVLVRFEDETEAWARGLVPGDEGRFERRREGRRELAILRHLERPSEHRVSPVCASVERCGGCPFGMVDPAYAREVKRSAVLRALGHGSLPDEAVGLLSSPTETGYRRRARLSFERRGHELAVGYRPFRSSRVVDVPSCPVLVPALGEVLAQLREALAKELVGEGELRIALGAEGRPVVALRSESAQSPAVYGALEAWVRAGRIAGAALFVAGATRPALFGDPVERTPALDGSSLFGTVDGFSQANDAIALAMARTVLSYAAPEGARVLELYAGHGHLGLGLAAQAASFVAVEQAKDAAESFRRNLRERGIAGKVIVGDAATAPRDPVDVVVLDPPRTGASEALETVAACRPRRIVMASCDPRSLERDLRWLRERGYAITHATAFDMFPGTSHVESVVRLEREAQPS